MDRLVQSFSGVRAECVHDIRCIEWVAPLIGAAAFGAAAGVMKFADQKIHIDPVRIPMVVFALVGAVLTWWPCGRCAGCVGARPRHGGKKQFRGAIRFGKSAVGFIGADADPAGGESFYHLRNTHHF